MKMSWIVSIGSASVGAFVTYQTLFSTKVSDASLFLRLILFSAEAILVTAVGRPHPKTTN
jgi:hypothetical protein